MFKPHRVTDNFESRVESTFRAPIAMNAGSMVDVDPSDTTNISGSQGFTSLLGGSLKLASVATGKRELGVTMVNVIDGGRPLWPDRILGLTAHYMTVPTGLNVPVYKTVKGDVIGTSEFVGNLAGDSALSGYLDTTNVANELADCGIYQGRFRLAQAGDEKRARYFGNTTQGGVAVALFEIL